MHEGLRHSPADPSPPGNQQSLTIAAETLAPSLPLTKASSLWQRAGSQMPTLRRLLAERSFAFGFTMVIVITLFCFIGPLFYRTDQIHTHLAAINLPPGGSHPLGTDDLGFDVLGRLMAGGQSALEVALGVAVVATSVGFVWGATAGFLGGIADSIMMRVVDVLVAIPALFIIVYLATIIRPNVWTLIAVIGFISWLAPARLIRGETLSIRTHAFVDAARTMGARSPGILRRHIIRNTVGVIVVNATFQVADAILLLALLSFLGFGLPPPAVTWGGMLSSGITFLYDGYWWQIYPAGAIIVITVVGFNMMGDGLRSLTDARLRQR